jgi:cell division ATPase FtsA
MHWLSSSGRKHSPYVIVIDIGGGTTDMAALKLATGNRYEPIPDLQHAGIPIGGNDIDAMLRDAVMQVMPQEAERAGGWLVKLRSLKERLARDTCAMFHVTVHAQACEVPREIVDAKVREFADRVQAAAGKFIEDFTELTGNRDCPILLAGGGSRLTGMQEAIESSTPPAKGRVMLWSDGDYAIVKGGVIQTSPPPKKTTVAVPPPLPIAHKKETVVVSKPIKPKVTEKLLDDDRVSQLRQEFQQQQQVEADRKFKEDAARQANEDYLKKIWNRANPQPRPSNNSNTTHQAKVADKIKKGCVLWIIAWLLLLLFINIIKLIK